MNLGRKYFYPIFIIGLGSVVGIIMSGEFRWILMGWSFVVIILVIRGRHEKTDFELWK